MPQHIFELPLDKLVAHVIQEYHKSESPSPYIVKILDEIYNRAARGL
jgi:hypothetical protein